MRGRVSFDFDGTLLRVRVDPEEGVIECGASESCLALLREAAAAGYEVIIVTSRHSAFEGRGRTDIRAFVAEHRLPVSEVLWTEGEWKAPLLARMGVIVHFDDDPEEITRCEEAGVMGVLIWNGSSM